VSPPLQRHRADLGVQGGGIWNLLQIHKRRKWSKVTLRVFMSIIIEVLNSCLGGRVVNCPICNVSVAMEDVNTHIDSGCKKKMLINASNTSKSGTKDQWSKIWSSSLKKGKNRVNG